MSLFIEPLMHVAVQCVSPHSAKISSSPFAVQCVSPYSACRHTVIESHNKDFKNTCGGDVEGTGGITSAFCSEKETALLPGKFRVLHRHLVLVSKLLSFVCYLILVS